MRTSDCNESALAVICSVFDAYSAVLFLGEPGEKCRLTAAFSLGNRVLPPEEADPGKGLVGWIERNNQPLLVNGFDSRKNHLGYYRNEDEADIKVFMGCPVPGGGVLCVDSKKHLYFSDKDHKILQLFADLLSRIQRKSGDAAAIGPTGDMPRYFAQLAVLQGLRFRHKRWPVFLEHFLRAVREAVGFDYCAFASASPDSQSYSIEGETAPFMLDGQDASLPVTGGIVGWVFRHEQPVFSESGSETALFGKAGETANFRTAMCLPVIISLSTRGVLCLAHTGVMPMPEIMRSFARQATDHLALFLENLYLKNRLRELLPGTGRRKYPPNRDPASASREE